MFPGVLILKTVGWPWVPTYATDILQQHVRAMHACHEPPLKVPQRDENGGHREQAGVKTQHDLHGPRTIDRGPASDEVVRRDSINLGTRRAKVP